jgi:hypothetical protein
VSGPLATPEDHARAIGEEFPGWEAWQSLNGLWHARIIGSVPPVMVHADTAYEIRAQIRAKIKGDAS